MRRGQSQSEASKQKISAWNSEYKGKPCICITTGRAYRTISSAAESLGKRVGVQVRPIQISRVCHGERNTVHGHVYRFIRGIGA